MWPKDKLPMRGRPQSMFLTRRVFLSRSFFLFLSFIDMVLARAAGVDALISRVLSSGDNQTNVDRDGKKKKKKKRNP